MLLIFVCSIFFSSFVVTRADCSIENVTSVNGYHYSDVLDSHSGVIVQFHTENISEAYIEDIIYINLTLKDNLLTLFTTEKFADYEKEQSKTSIKFLIRTICNGDSYINSLTYTIYLEDTNTYEPIFNKAVYTYTFFDAIPANYDIAAFANIYVTDYDIGNLYIDFEIEDNQYLTVSNAYKGAEKEYYAKLVTKESINGPFNVTYKMTATDKGEPPKSSSANVTLIITTLTNIAFTKSLYVGRIASSGEVFVDNGPITVQNLIGDLTDFEVSIENDYLEQFEVELSTSVKLLANDVHSLISSVENQNTIIVKLIASKGSSTSEAAVLIDLSTTENHGVCSVDRIQNLNTIYENPQEVLDTFVGEIERLEHVNLDDAYMKNTSYLSARLENGYLVINTTSEFAHYEDKEQRDTVTATLVTKCADELNELEYIVYIKDSNNHPPTFEEDHYQFLFYDNIPDSPDFDLNQFNEIVATDKDLTNTNITFEIEDNEYLSLEYGGQCVRGTNRFYATLSLRRNVTAHFNETYKITAMDDGTPPKNSTAKLTLTVLRAEAPQFTQSMYTAVLTKEKKIYVTNGPIALEDITSFDDLTFDISMEYDNYFRISVDDEINISVQKDVDLSGLITPENTSVIISLYAEGLSPEIYAESSLVLDMYSLLDDVETTTAEVVTTSTTPRTTTQSSTVIISMPGLQNWLGYSLSVLIMFAAISTGLIGGLVILVWMIAFAKKREASKAAAEPMTSEKVVLA